MYTGPIPTAHHPHLTSSLSTGLSTSTHPSPLPTPTGATPSRPSGTVAIPFTSPIPNSTIASITKSRSNSTSSIATQASHAQAGVTDIGNSPTPTMGTVPGIGATNSAAPSVMPLSTPPMTPMSTTSSMNGGVLGKRDTGGVSESDQDEKKAKKRRIAPTPVGPETS